MLINIIGAISTLVSFVGVIGFFFNPTITVVCGIISAADSLLQFFFGQQNNLSTEIFTVIVSLIIALIFKLSILTTICFALCLVSAIFSILGWIQMFTLMRK